MKGFHLPRVYPTAVSSESKMRLPRAHAIGGSLVQQQETKQGELILQMHHVLKRVALSKMASDQLIVVSVSCYPRQVSMIEKAMRDVHFSAHPTRSAKQQVG